MTHERPLERFPAKWTRFALRKRVKIRNLEPRFDSIETEKALGTGASCFRRRGLVAGNKIMLCGNGGSAADRQHVEDALC